jgi:acetyl-CoA carboxylase biotin carboxyl carrier protein
MSDLKTIRQLIKMMVDNDISEIDLEGDGEKIKLKRGAPGSGAPPVGYLPAPPSAPAPAAPAGADAPAPDDGEDDDAHEGTFTIDSPMVGTFYTASSPDADAFISVGDRVKPDTVICIVEAMKVFNEIKAEASGKIVEVLVENGQSVEFGQPLYRVRP